MLQHSILFLARSVLLNFLVFWVVLLCVFTLWVPCCDVRYDFRIKTMFGCFHLRLFVGGLTSYLRYLCLFVHSGVQHILCCVFVLFFFILCTLMLSVSLDCPILTAQSVFSNVYLNHNWFSHFYSIWWFNKYINSLSYDHCEFFLSTLSLYMQYCDGLIS